MTVIAMERADFVSRQTYRTLIEEQYKALINSTNIIVDNNFLFLLGKLAVQSLKVSHFLEFETFYGINYYMFIYSLLENINHRGI